MATSNHPIDPPGSIDPAEFVRVLSTNVVGTCRITQTFLPIIRPKDDSRGKVIYVSSFLGSIGANSPSETNFYMATSYR